ncbi:Mur ligase [Phlyctochytrium arcticum]|nr:Mur ligase [Phlyctochytrium arcticum]
MTSTSNNSYEAAVTKLNNLQTNAAVLEVLKKAGMAMNQRSLPEMKRYIERIGYQPADLDKLNIIHVAGTKGKGSTSAIVESILRRVNIVENGTSRPLRTGLFTSPHLIEARERIRINGKPIDRDLFAKYFFDVWGALEKNKPADTDVDMPDKPQYFRYLTLMAFHALLSEKVDVVLLEVGMGGQFDSTNIVPKPVVCGITSLGYDHVPLLGTTLADIAWHKAGIMKPGVPVLSVSQDEEAMPVLHARAKELEVCQTFSCFENAWLMGQQVSKLTDLILGMAASYQLINATLAVALSKEWIAQMRRNGLSLEGVDEAIKIGLAEAKWPGRAQKFVSNEFSSISWYLDGAHTKESMSVCADWFRDEVISEEKTGKSGEQVLLFNCTKGREGVTLLRALAEMHKTTVPFSKIVFSTNECFPPKSGKSKTDQTNHTVSKEEVNRTQQELREAWKTLVGNSESCANKIADVEIHPNIEDAIHAIKRHFDVSHPATARVLVTGSLYLVGGLLTVLKADVV